jgi:hypothetical protein
MNVTEVKVNDPDDVYVERKGRLLTMAYISPTNAPSFQTPKLGHEGRRSADAAA